MSRIPVEFHDWPDELPFQFGPYRAVVRWVVDGDTLDLLVDTGFNNYAYRRIRLMAATSQYFADIDAPEKNRAATKEAGLAAMRWLVETVPLGTAVLVETLPDPDSFGRYLAAITVKDGRDLGTALVEAGHARFREYR